MKTKISRNFDVFNICSNNPVNIKIINHLKKNLNIKMKIKNF